MKKLKADTWYTVNGVNNFCMKGSN